MIRGCAGSFLCFPLPDNIQNIPPEAGRKTVTGDFVWFNFYTVICMESCLDGKAGFRIIFWFYLEYHPPLYFWHRLKMQGGNCRLFFRSGVFSGHKYCCGAV